MNSRERKKRISKFFYGRLYSLFIYQSAEDQTWLDSGAVGREFDNPDYERLEKLDAVAYEVFGSWELVREWLDKPHLSLDGMTPEDATRMATGADKVMGILSDLKLGIETRSGSVTDIKGIFGKATRTVSVEMMNEAIAQCGASAVNGSYPRSPRRTR